MEQIELNKLFRKIQRQYEDEINIHSGECEDDRPYSIVIFKEIVFPEKAFRKPCEWDILCLLHEIGHVKTNIYGMPQYKREYLATQWSADEARKIGFKIKKLWKNCFQEYIWEFREEEKKNNKKVPSKYSLKVKW